jgi:hypothetical protein
VSALTKMSLTYLLAALAVRPLLVAEDGHAALLGHDTLVLLEGCTECAGRNLRVLVETVKKS